LTAVSRIVFAALTLALAGASASCMTLRRVSTASPVARWGIHLKWDNRWSIAYSEELISSTISATFQSMDRRHGIMGQGPCHFQLAS
jgi:hypothetical protein